jgi:hypothetical protein
MYLALRPALQFLNLALLANEIVEPPVGSYSASSLYQTQAMLGSDKVAARSERFSNLPD